MGKKLFFSCFSFYQFNDLSSMGTKFKGDKMKKRLIIYLCLPFYLLSLQEAQKEDEKEVQNQVVCLRQKVRIPGVNTRGYPGFIRTPQGIFYCMVFSKVRGISAFIFQGKSFKVHFVEKLEGAFSVFLDMMIDQFAHSHFSMKSEVYVHMGSVDVSRERRINQYFAAFQLPLKKS